MLTNRTVRCYNCLSAYSGCDYMPRIIDELWYGQVDPIEFFGKNNSELKISEAKAIEKIEANIHNISTFNCNSIFIS